MNSPIIIKIHKYLYIKNYLNFLYRYFVFARIKFSGPLILKTSCLGFSLKFSIKSRKEYINRYLLSYVSEKSTVEWINRYINKNDVVWDVGANVGAYSLLIGKKKFSHGSRKASVFSFEPESSNFYSLNQNILLNNLTDFVVAYPIAIGSETRLSLFYLSSNEIGSATHSVDRAYSDGRHFIPTHVQGAIVASLDDLTYKYELPFPNHIKIDVDGFEREVISGGINLIKDTRLRTILIEVGKGVNREEVCRIIADQGFKLELEEPVSADGLNVNYLYIRIKN